MTQIVVPDSIDPYVGYKSLAVIHNGLLCSPQQMDFVWPAKQRAEATCLAPDSYGWKLVPAGQEVHYPTLVTGFMITSSSSAASHSLNMVAPPYEAPAGKVWSWEKLPHKVGDRMCSCGIYAVDEPKDGLFGYIADHHVIVKIALWGTVTRGNKGARGQYAYPQEIVGWTTSHIEHVSETYGIPVNPDPKLQVFIGQSVGFNRARARLRALQAGGASFQGGGGVVSSGAGGVTPFWIFTRVAAFAAVAGAGSVVLSAFLNPLVGIAWSLTLCLFWIFYCKKVS